MLKTICLFVLFIQMTIPPVYCQNTSSDRDIIRDLLAIEVKQGLFASYTPNINLLMIHQYSNWTFYHGFAAIDEPTFLLIAGFPNEAEEARKFKVVDDILNISAATTAISGTLLLTTGLIAIIIALSYDDIFSPEALRWNDLAQIGMWTGLGLSTATIIPAVIQMSRGTKWMPLEKAYQIMQLYNAEQRERATR